MEPRPRRASFSAAASAQAAQAVDSAVPRLLFEALGKQGTGSIGLSNAPGESAEEVLRALAPSSAPETLKRLRKERIHTARDLAALTREDLAELGLTIGERSRVQRWARLGDAKGDAVRGLPTADEEEGCGTPGRGDSPRGSEDQQARWFLTQVERKHELWCRLASSSSASHILKQLRGADGKDVARRGRRSGHSLRESLLEAQFDLTPERVRDVYRRTREWAQGAIDCAEQLFEGLRRCGLTGVSIQTLGEAMEAVTNGRSARAEGFDGLTLPEFEVILCRLKLGQLLVEISSVAATESLPNHLVYMDYDLHDFRPPVSPSASELASFFFGHRTRLGEASEGEPVRWIHLSGRNLALLLALTAKYRLHPLLVEGIMEQCQTKVDRYDNHYFLAIAQLCLANPLESDDETEEVSRPVQVRGRHISIICTGPPALDTVVTVVQPDLGFSRDWPGGVTPITNRHLSFLDETAEVDHWVSVLQQRVQAVRSRVRERRADFLVYQIINLCADDLIEIVRAYAARLSHLEGDLKGSVPPSSAWLREVGQARLQLAVLTRRMRGLRRMIRHIEDDHCLSAGLSTYFEDTGDHVDEAQEDAMQLAERCASFLTAYEHMVERQQEHLRKKEQEQERARAEAQNRNAERLNNTLFVLTVATTIFAPVQFIAGVYGMNFTTEDGKPGIPELLWEQGYLIFWCVVLGYLVLAGLFAVWLFRRLRLNGSDDTEPEVTHNVTSNWSGAGTPSEGCAGSVSMDTPQRPLLLAAGEVQPSNSIEFEERRSDAGPADSVMPSRGSHLADDAASLRGRNGVMEL